MEYAEVQSLIQTNVEGLGYEVMFGHGRAEDFKLLKNKKYPLVWLDPMEVSGSNPNTFDNTQSWSISMVFLVKATPTDQLDEQNSLVNFGEQIANDFINKLDSSDRLEFASKPVIKPLHRTAFGTDHTSGCILTFSLIVYDTYTC